mmetsp:Transcript_69781/g.110276  ORF Transcript_69781/g.110276 Transcript_69781/m.110276 type:complete len:288 (+) Transcript_69781:79-942(+)
MGTWGAAGLEVWTRDAEAARRPIGERKSAGSIEGGLVDKDRMSAAMRSETNFDFDVKMEGANGSTKPLGDVSSRRFENAVWRLMQKEKRTTWNEECLRKAVATIGKEIDFSCMTSSTSNKEAVSHHLPEPLGGPAVSRKRRSLDNRAASLPNPQGSLLDVQRLENAVWRLWPREQRAWQPWYSVLPDEGEKASEELGSQIDLLQVQRLLHKQDVLSQFALQLVQRAHSIGAQSTETPATPRSLASSAEAEDQEESTGGGWMDAAVPTVWILGGVLMAVGTLRALKGM